MKRAKILILVVLFGVTMASVIARLSLGRTLLFRAARGGHSLLVKALVVLGSSVGARDESGGTALFYAAANGHARTVRTLLALGSDATAADKHGNTALCSALNNAVPNEETVELLAGHGALAKQARSGNPLFCIEHSASSESFVKLLMKLGVDPNAVESGSYTPLMKFAYDGNVEVVGALLQYGATVNIATADGKTALSEAVAQGNDAVVEVLLKAGADPAIRANGLTLADVAIRKKAAFQAVNNQTMVSRYDRIVQLLVYASGVS